MSFALHPALARLPPRIEPALPATALAPMQDVTDLGFMRLVAHYGAPDYYFTEYFRVHGQSRLEAHIVRSITENDTGRPVFAQMIGESLPDFDRTIGELERLPVAGIDLNLGCPAPKIYKKNVGGGLLRDPARIDAILGFLRARIGGRFTVKMRLGFDSPDVFPRLLDLVQGHRADLLSLHGRTVRELYRPGVHYAYHATAAARLGQPVLANGDVTSAAKAAWVLSTTGAAGVMIGRSAIRNPWIFRQVREHLAGRTVFRPKLADVRDYVERLYAVTRPDGAPETARVSKMKKYLNFVGQGVDPEGRFLYDMRRAVTAAELFEVCDRHLLAEPTQMFADEPYPGVVARPSRESPAEELTCSL